MALVIDGDTIRDGDGGPVMTKKNAPHLWPLLVQVAALSVEDARAVKWLAEEVLLDAGEGPSIGAVDAAEIGRQVADMVTERVSW